MRNNTEIRRGIFGIYEITKDLWNDYYLGYYNNDNNYSENDVKHIKELMNKLKEEIENIESEVE